MERICPFLALGDDHRTVIDGYDPGHLCHARIPAEVVDRAQQAEACLVDAHRQCEFYLAFLAERAATAPPVPMPSPDTHLSRTRLVLGPESRRLGVGQPAPFGMSPGRWLVAGGIAAVGVAAAATAVAGGFGPRAGSAASPSSQASQPAVVPPASATALPTLEPTAVPTAQPTPGDTPSASRTPRPQRSAPATPEPQTYVVQPGDTLSIIADQFGTSVEALQAANGIDDPDEIVPGQVLIIPS